MAHKGGAFAVAVHTGIGHAQSFSDLPQEHRPHLDVADVGALAQLLRAQA
jgi:NagD protein